MTKHQQNAPDNSASLPPPPVIEPHKPPGKVERLAIANQNYHSLQGRAKYDSMSWWKLRIEQGCLFVLGLILFDGLLFFFMVLTGIQEGWPYFQLPLAVIAVFAFVRNLTAPLNNQIRFRFLPKDEQGEVQKPGLVRQWLFNIFSCRWRVVVPETWYYAVENQDGFTQQFLGQGYHDLQWRPGWRVEEYTDKCSFAIEDILIDNVLDMRQFPVQIIVSVTMKLDPTKADKAVAGTLRKKLSYDAIKGMLATKVKHTVIQFVNGTLDEEVHAVARNTATSAAQIDQPKPLIEVLCQSLSQFSSMGLSVSPSSPPVVHINYPKNSELQNQLGRAQNMDDVGRIAHRFSLTGKEILQLLRLTRGYPSTERVKRRSPAAAVQPPLNVPAAKPEPAVAHPQPIVEPPPVDDSWADIMSFFDTQTPPTQTTMRRVYDSSSEDNTTKKDASRRRGLSRPVDH